MIKSKSLRWSGATISNGRQSLTPHSRGVRYYSFTSSTTSSLYTNSLRSRHSLSYRPSVQQSRSISLWGWGSSTSKDADFAKLHTPRQSSIPDEALGYDGQILAQRAAGESRSIPAVHQTSDTPSSTSFPDSKSIPTETNPSLVDQIVSPPGDFPPSDNVATVEATSSIPERIGYLKEVCGLDFGFGPSSLMEFILEHIHITGGVSWTTSIILLAVLNRLIIFFPMLRSSNMSAIYREKKSYLEPLQMKMRAAARAKDTQKLAELRMEKSALQKEWGIKPVQIFWPMLFQMPLGYGAFRVLRNAASLPVPAFVHENWLWAKDLTYGDPYFIIPLASSLILYRTIKRGGEMGISQVQGPMRATFSLIFPGISFMFLVFQPGAVQLFFFMSGILAFIQSRLLTNNSFREKLGLHPLAIQPEQPSINTVINATTTNTSTSPSNTITTTTTPPPTNPSLGPGGLKLYQPPRPTTTTTTLNLSTPPPPKDVSLIDKYVDKVKSHKDEAMNGWYKMMGTTSEEKEKERQRDKVVKDAENYEKMKAGQDESRRVERNEKAMNKKGRRREEE